MAINIPKLPFKLPRIPIDRLGPRTRKILRIVGYVFFAIIVFVFALQMTFPYDRVKDKIIDAMAEKYEVTISSVERGWMPGRVYFHGFSIRSRQTKPDETITQVYIDRLEVDVGILSLIGGTISVDFDARLGDKRVGFGNLEGSLELASFGRGSTTIHIEGNSLPGDALPLRALLGLPMTGKLQFGVDAHLPVEKSKLGKTAINWQKATGSLSLTCPSGCTFGDGKTKLKPLLKNTRNQAMVGEGIDFGKVTMETLVAKATMKKGKLTLDKFETSSKDGQLKVDYMMTLEKEFGESMVAGCLRFKGSDDLLRREPKTHAAMSTTGAELRSDGLFHIRLTDRFKDMKRLNQECGPGTNTSNGEDFSRTANRPNLTVQPDQGTAPTPGSATPPPPTTPGSAAAGSPGEVTKPLTAAPAPTPPHDGGAAGSAVGSATGSGVVGGPPPTPASGAVQPGSAGHPADGKGSAGSAQPGEHVPPAQPPVE
jgi:type II secretion system protein N